MDLAVKRLSDRIAELEEENRQLREALVPSRFAISPVPEVHLTKKEAILLSCLLAHDAVSKKKAYTALYGLDSTADPKGLDVYIYHLRQKLGPYGFSIRNFHGQGYQLVRPAAAA